MVNVQQNIGIKRDTDTNLVIVC